MRIALAIVFLAGCASPRGVARMSTGSEDLDRARSAVVFLSSDCSGVLVAPRVVLTAAHCVLGLDALPSVQVRHGAEVWESAVARCATHPSAVDGGTERCDVGARDTHREHDLAVLHLASEVPSAMAQPLPILIAPPIVASDAWWRGRHVVTAQAHQHSAFQAAFSGSAPASEC